MADCKPYLCNECRVFFGQKCHLTRHFNLHAKEKHICHLCSKPFSRRDNLNRHITNKHKTMNKEQGFPCPKCGKQFSRKFNLERHQTIHTLADRNNEPAENLLLDEMRCNAHLYKEHIALGKHVASNLQEYDDIPEQSLSVKHRQILELYKENRLQHRNRYENVTLKPWQKKVMTLVKQPSHREVIWVVGQKGGEGKTFLQNYIKFYYSDRRVIATDIATDTKNLAHFLTKFPLECKDIFLFNHPCSTTETIAYDMLEGIKDGYKVSAKYDTKCLFFKTPNTVIVFSNKYPRTEALKGDRWRIYEIKGEDLIDKTAPATKPKRHVVKFLHKNYAV